MTAPNPAPPNLVAGPSAYFSNPGGMDIMSDNSSLLIADTGYGCIRRVDLASLVVTRWAGNCSSASIYADGPSSNATFLRPTALAITLDRGAVYVVDNSTTLRQITVTSGGWAIFSFGFFVLLGCLLRLH